MVTVMILHDVDDVDHWLCSSRRTEFLGALGIDGVGPETVVILTEAEVRQRSARPMFPADDRPLEPMR